jgi:hypothetical protein
MGLEVMVPIWINRHKYCNCVWVVFGCKSCSMEGLLGVIFSRGVDLDLSWPPCAAKKNLMEGNLHHQMGQNFNNFFS